MKFILIQYSRKALIGLFIVTAVIFLIITGIMTEGKPNTPDSLQYLSGWTAVDTSAETEHTYFSENKQSYILTMTHELTAEMHGKVISFRTNDSYVDAYLLNADGQPEETLYHFGEQLRFGDSPGTYTHFIEMPDSGSGQVMIRIETAYKNKFLMGNTAQSWWCRCAVRFFVRLYRNDAAGLAPSKEFLCKMTEKMQADAPPSRQAGFVRCCPWNMMSQSVQRMN